MGNIINVSVGDDGTVLCIDNTQTVWLRAANSPTWQAYEGARAMMVSCARQDHIWILTAAGDPFQYFNNQWVAQRLTVKFVDISTGSDGTVWGVDRNFGLWYRTHANPNWTQERTGRARQVSVAGQNHVWCLTEGGDLFQWQNGAWQLRKRATGAGNMSVGMDGALWFVGPNGRIFRPHGGDWFPDPNGTAMQLSVRNNNEVWAVTFSGDLYQFLNGAWKKAVLPNQPSAPSAGAGGQGAPSLSGRTRTYQIKAGESLGILAQRFGVVLSDLLKVNPQIKNPNVVSAGQLINVPVMATTYQVYQVQPGDSMGAIATRAGLTYPRLLQANPQIINPDLINLGDVVYIPPA